MQSRGAVVCLAAVGMVVALASSAGAQTNPVRSYDFPYALDSGVLENNGDEYSVVFDAVVMPDDVAPWVRLSFSAADLPGGSYVVITSLEDGKYQTLTARGMREWYRHSAYFNGSSVLVELYAAPGTTGNRIAIDKIVVGEWAPGDNVITTQCGPTDDRVASSDPAASRLLNIGCTATMFSDLSCFISAGHCVQSLANTVEFNVPLSSANGTIQHPGPEDQYSVDQASREFTNGGLGNDWGLFKVFDNTQTGLQPFEAQGAMYPLATALPSVNDTIQYVGYGIDSGTANQTQQFASGPVTSVDTTPPTITVNHQADTEGGCSGSAIRSLGNEIVAIHTHGGCTTGGSGSNGSTGITHSGLQAALVGFCDGGGGGGNVTCADIEMMRVRCRNGKLRILVRLVDSSHSGETVTVDVDGTLHVLTINNDVATLVLSNQVGSHTVTLTEPADCLDPQTTTCN